MADKKNVVSLAILAILLIAYMAWALGTPSTATPADESAENIVAGGDLFEGKITNKNVVAGRIVGVGEYDRNCVSVGDGLTNCHAGIKTSKYGVLDFNYVHDMAKKPCIAPGNKVVVDIIDSSGNAKVQKV